MAVAELLEEDADERRRRQRGERREEEHRAQRDDGPVEHHAQQPRASAAHAPDGVEGVFDRGEELDDDEDERQRADRAGRARAGAGDEVVDELHERGIGGGPGSGGAAGGARARRSRVRVQPAAWPARWSRCSYSATCGAMNLMTRFIVLTASGRVALVEHEARHEHGDGHERAQPEQRGVAQRRRARGDVVFKQAGVRDRYHAQQDMDAAAHRVIAERHRLPDAAPEQVLEPAITFSQPAHAVKRSRRARRPGAGVFMSA